MVSLDQQCLSTAGIVADCVLRNEHWQAFGYRKRPRQGKFWDIFVSAKKIEQEKVLTREFWAASFGRVFYWALKRKEFIHRIDFIAQLMNLCIDGIDNKPWWPAFGFITPNDAFDFLQQSCRDYGSCRENSDFSKVFVRRCISYLNQKLPSIWIFGAVWLFSHSNSLFMAIIPALDDTIEQNQKSDINIRNSKYFEVAEKLFIQLESV
jgi:hypothetical protein